MICLDCECNIFCSVVAIRSLCLLKYVITVIKTAECEDIILITGNYRFDFFVCFTFNLFVKSKLCTIECFVLLIYLVDYNLVCKYDYCILRSLTFVSLTTIVRVVRELKLYLIWVSF